MVLDRRDFLKALGATGGLAAVGRPNKALSFFNEMSKKHNLSSVQEKLLKFIVKKNAFDQSQVERAVTWIENDFSSKQVNILADFLSQDIDKRALKVIEDEFKKGELIPENGYEIRHEGDWIENGKDYVGRLMFEMDGEVQFQFVYNNKKLPEGEDVIDRKGSVDEDIWNIVELERIMLEGAGVKKEILDKLIWLRSKGIALPPRYWHNKIKKKEDPGENHDYITIEKTGWTNPEGCLPLTHITEEKILIYNEGIERQVDIINDEDRIKLILRSKDGNGKDKNEIVYVYSDYEMKSIIKDHFSKDLDEEKWTF